MQGLLRLRADLDEAHSTRPDTEERAQMDGLDQWGLFLYKYRPLATQEVANYSADIRQYTPCGHNRYLILLAVSLHLHDPYLNL